jgi:hypothetical protein
MHINLFYWKPTKTIAKVFLKSCPQRQGNRRGEIRANISGSFGLGVWLSGRMLAHRM